MSLDDQHEVNKVFANVGKSLAAFQSTLQSETTKFDLYLEGLKENNSQKIKSLTKSEIRGLKIFIGKGSCIDCHTGPNLSDGEFHLTQVPSVVLVH